MSVNYDQTAKQAIKGIINDVRSRRHQAGAASDISGIELGSADIVNPIMLENLDKMNRTTVNRSYRTIPAHGLRGKISKLVKRIMRKLTFWYVEPCMVQQTEYNAANSAFSAEVNSEINLLKLGHSDNLDKIEGLSGRADTLSGTIADGFRDRDILISSLSQKIDRLDAQLATLKSDRTMGDKIAHFDALYQKNNELINQTFELIENRFEQNEKRFEQNEKRFEQNEKRFEQNEKRFDEYVEFDRRRSEYEAEQCLRSSFSQSGEDSIIRNIFSSIAKKLDTVVYLDLGANHAKELSNTYYFYNNGGRGVLVEANPQLIDELKNERPRDIILNNCIANTDNSTVDFYILNGDGLSTSDSVSVQNALKENKNLKIEKTVRVKTITMDSIIRQYFYDSSPDIMNIDVEGIEMDILQSIDFSVFRPMMIICEMIEYKSIFYVGERKKEILDFMSENGYVEYAFTGINSIFIDKQTYADSEKIYWDK